MAEREIEIAKIPDIFSSIYKKADEDEKVLLRILLGEAKALVGLLMRDKEDGDGDGDVNQQLFEQYNQISRKIS